MLREETKHSNHLKTEACAVVVKLDEARLVMNKLLGPQGPLNQAERHKFLNSKVNDSDYRVEEQTGNNNSWRQMSPAPKASVQKETFGIIDPKEVDGEDDFWYQTPNGQSGYANNY